MKLSDVKGERVYDVIAEIIEPIANIAADKETVKLFAAKSADGATANELAISRIKKSLPHLLKNHKGDITAILAAIEGVPPAEYKENLTMPKLISGCFELLTDDCFTDLFPSAQKTEKR